MVNVFTGRDSLEAHFVRGLLEQHEIRAVVLGETLGAARGDLPLTSQTLPGVWVNPEDAAAASEVVEEFVASSYGDKKDAPAGPAWQCPFCEEMIEGQFDECWHCGAIRPG